jgi:hypothetical protein
MTNLAWAMLGLFLFTVAGHLFWTIKNGADRARRRKLRQDAATAKYQTASGLDEPIQNRQEYLALLERLDTFNATPELKAKAQQRIDEYEQKREMLKFMQNHT